MPELKCTPGEWFYHPYKAWQICVEIVDIAKRMSKGRVKSRTNMYVVADCGGPGSVSNMMQNRANATLFKSAPKLWRFIDSLVKTGVLQGALAEQANAILTEATAVPQKLKEFESHAKKQADLARNARKAVGIDPDTSSDGSDPAV
jgi:hypothetical protein